MQLEVLEIFSATFSLIFVAISSVLSLIIISHYFKERKSAFLLVGIAIFGLAGPWFPDSLTFIYVLLTASAYDASIYLEFTILANIITTALTPISIMAWQVVITDFLDVPGRKAILAIFVVILLIFEFLFFFFVFTDMSWIGIFYGPFNYQWGLLTTIYYLGVIFVIIITGIPFAISSIKTDSAEIRVKGKFLLGAMISFVIGALIPYIIFNIPFLVVSRLILIISSVEFYIGFTLPKWIGNLIIREE